MLGPAERTHPDTAYITDVWKENKITVMLSCMLCVSWNYCSPTLHSSFVVLLQAYTDKTATTEKTSAMIAHPIPIIPLNITPVCRRRLIDEGYTLLRFLHVSNADEKDSARDSPVDQSAAMDDASIQVTASADQIPFHDYLSYTTAVDGTGSSIRILHNSLRES